jgi:aspartate carbamoyltransferase catalytic subunit
VPYGRKDLLQIRGLSAEEITAILETARGMRGVSRDPGGKAPALGGRVVVNLFLEPSTRTRTSFEVAAKRLSADTVTIEGSNSSLVKGESLVDTARNLDAMSPSVIVIRHSASGAPHALAANTRAAVVNAGDGAHEHPTQALLDALTISDRKGRIAGLQVVIAGDIRHSRVARSNIHLLTRLGAHVRLAGPRALIPEGIEAIAEQAEGSVSRAGSFEEALEGADVVMMLRVQLERLRDAFVPSLGEYHGRYGLTPARLRLAAPDAIVMHPGPVNRGVELSPEVADCAQAVILDQVANGVAVRMAVLSLLAGVRGQGSGVS